MSSKNFFMNKLHRQGVNLTDYYYYTNAFSNEEIEQIKLMSENYPKQSAKTEAGDGVLSDYRKSEICWIPENEESSWLYQKIAEYANEANRIMWNFDIWGFPDDLQYTYYYGDGGHYDWHMDVGPSLANRKLSMVLQLTGPDEYSGGDLQINCGGNVSTVPKEKGLIAFFPSFLLHRVTPTLDGTRISLVTWLGGNSFR
jgi:PKHD-type hydroxylase